MIIRKLIVHRMTSYQDQLREEAQKHQVDQYRLGVAKEFKARVELLSFCSSTATLLGVMRKCGCPLNITEHVINHMFKRKRPKPPSVAMSRWMEEKLNERGTKILNINARWITRATRVVRLYTSRHPLVNLREVRKLVHFIIQVYIPVN